MATMDKTEDASSQPGEPVRFQAEIRQLLDILVHSLYTRREVFLRELISNASDALNRMQFEMLTNTDVVDAQVAAAVRITVDEAGKRLTISDTGVGMSRAELVENLGTIARSGAQRFIENAKETGTDASDIIGRFGVGFYSVFMIAEEVRVTSRSFRPTDEAACWVCTGGESFTLESSDRKQRGTLIEIKLREEAAEFADAFRITQIVKQHSDYVPFPIYVGKQADKPGEFMIANQQTALWRQPARDLKAGEYVEFFRQLTFSGGDPLLHIHYVADAPVQIYSILFVPAKAGRDLFTARYESGIRLHARKILIEENCRSLVPEYLRFLQGVVDCEDLPLNVARENVQSSPLLGKISRVLGRKVVDEFKKLAVNDGDKYLGFWNEFGIFLKEGAATDPEAAGDLMELLRFRSTLDDAVTALAEYVQRIKDERKEIYYLLADDLRSATRSPHLDYFKRNGYEVLLLVEPVDAFLMANVREFDGHKLVNVASGDIKLPPAAEAEDATVEEPLAGRDLARLIVKFKSQLGTRVADVRDTDRLSGSPVRLVDSGGAPGREVQRAMRVMDREYEQPKMVLELNTRHPLLRSLVHLPEPSEILDLCVEQLFDAALLLEGLHPDPAGIVPRLQDLMQAAVGKAVPAA